MLVGTTALSGLHVCYGSGDEGEIDSLGGEPCIQFLKSGYASKLININSHLGCHIIPTFGKG